MESYDRSSEAPTESLMFTPQGNGTVANDTLEQFSPVSAPLEVWLPTALVYGITFVVGLIGNVLVIFSIQRCRRLQNVTNTFIASLAAADLIIVVIVIPVQMATYFQPRWELGELMCKLLPYLTLLSSSCSIFMLTAMSAERIIYELWKSTKKARKMQNQTARNEKRIPLNNQEPNGNVTVTVTDPMSGYELVELEQKKKKKKKRKTDATDDRKQVIIMLVVVVALFMTCWGPVIWLTFVTEFGIIERFSLTRTILAISFNLLSYLNSCMNPICYAFVSRTFRECFFWACRTCCRRNRGRDIRSNTSGVFYSKSSSTATYGYSRYSPDRQSDTVGLKLNANKEIITPTVGRRHLGESAI
uniref:Neuropeptides B/W receptor type 1-like n=1 Tax=Saccoglossus kowalevskii TaxID=10224 RepID=A0ABM0M9A7_SACKO|nr:PREDICTED: neuropeptides B/W receptor type 1-like [Saccoglossus kowalevskii]